VRDVFTLIRDVQEPALLKEPNQKLEQEPGPPAAGQIENKTLVFPTDEEGRVAWSFGDGKPSLKE
jgi:hypothetical protein